MLLDLRYLFEKLSSEGWSWTVDCVESLLQALGLIEEPVRDTADTRRLFRARSGLRCLLLDGSNGSPAAFEFRFPIPDEVGRQPELLGPFALITAATVSHVFGPAEVRLTGAASGDDLYLQGLRWQHPRALITLSLCKQTDGQAESLALGFHAA